MKMTVYEHVQQDGQWYVSGEIGEGDEIQYFHALAQTREAALESLIKQAKSFKKYELEIESEN